MFCILKYLDYTEYEIIHQKEQAIATSKISLDGTEDNAKNKYLFFNPNCLLQLILDYICIETKMDYENSFDLCNEAGELMGVKDYKPTVNGMTIFTPRETYFIVFLKKRSSASIDEICPLLSKTSKEYISLAKNLKKNSTRKKSSMLKRYISNKGSKHSITVSQSSNNSGPIRSNSKRRSSAVL